MPPVFYNTCAKVSVVTNNPALNIDPIENWKSPSLPPAIATKTSGAPLPNATSVTPAKVYEQLKKFDNPVRAGVK